MEKKTFATILVLAVLLAYTMGFMHGALTQQRFFLYGAVEVAEGLEGANIEINVDLNETKIIEGTRKITEEVLVPLLNQTLNNGSSR